MAESRELKLNRGRGRQEMCCWREAGIHDRKTEYSQACTVCRAVLQDSNKKRLQTGDKLSKTLSSSDCVMDSDIPKLVLTAVTVCQ